MGNAPPASPPAEPTVPQRRTKAALIAWSLIAILVGGTILMFLYSR